MGILDHIRRDVIRYTSDPDGFGVELTLESPKPDPVTVTLYGTASKHHLSVDTNGNPVNSKNASCSIAESLLVDLEYPVRDASGEVNLKHHKVTWTDSSGSSRTYLIQQWFPNETIGLITCICGNFQT